MAQVDSENTTPMPEESPGPLYIPTDATPEKLFVAIGKLRKEARDEIDRLIRFLDKTDDYVSRELEVEEGNDEPGGDDEPSLGAADRLMDQSKSWRRRSGEFDIGDDAELDNCDNEPILGALPSTDQTDWEKHSGGDREGDGCADDREGDELEHGGDEHDGREPSEDDEPSLGALEGHDDQGSAWSGEITDHELDHSESGIADQDGLDEQAPFRDWQGVGMV